MAKKKFPKGRFIGIVLSSAVLGILLSNLYVPTYDIAIFDNDLIDNSRFNSICNGNPDCIADLDNFIIKSSVVNTDVVYTETNNGVVSNFLESQGLSFDEQFGILTNIALVDSNGNKITDSNIFGIDEVPNTLSVTDSQGNPLDLGGTVQVTFKSIAQNIPKSVTSWADVKFYLDDNLISDGSKKLWSSYNDKSTGIMSVVNSLELTDSLPKPPLFSEREKDNFTFRFDDEGLSDGTHTFRVVFNEIDAVVDGKKFEWNGEYIAYSLDFLVNNNKITKESDTGNNEKISVFKSDNVFKYIKNSQVVGKSVNNSFAKFADLTPIMNHIVKIYVDDILLKTIDNTSDSFELNFARNSQFKVTVDGETIFDEKMPVTQINHYLVLQPQVTATFVKYGSCHSSGGGSVFAFAFIGGIQWASTITSSFDYENSVKENGIGATSNQPYPC